MLYSDDLLIMCIANRQEAQIVKNCFDLYCGFSGQEPNVEKSSIFFSKNIVGTERLETKNILGFKEMSKDSIYLGNFLILTENKLHNFKGLKERINSWLKG